MPGSLSHVRVLDLSRILAGPWAGQMLADLGAEVIKVERPGQDDDTRTWGAPYLKGDNGQETTETAYFLCANRGKRSVTLDIASPAGQKIVRELAKHSAVLIENFKRLEEHMSELQSLMRISYAVFSWTHKKYLIQH